ncbi:MAG: hypothetical protein GX664_03585 [Bacteroidales bacterium]|nr:hypothetical protein [Bacteroidales bacterium]
MKMRYAFLALALFMSLSLSAQRNEVLFGGGIPIYSLLGVNLPYGLDKTSGDFNLGYKRIKPLSEHFDFYWRADINFRRLQLTKDNYATSKIYTNTVMIPVGAGYQFKAKFNSNTSFYVGLSGGLNIIPGRNLNKPFDLSIFPNAENQLKDKSFKREQYTNRTSFFTSLSFLTPNTGISLFFCGDIGVIISDRYTFGLNYSNYGIVQISRSKSFYCLTDDDCAMLYSQYGQTSMILSNLGLRVGYLF